MKLFDHVRDALTRLDDAGNEVWSDDEMGLYVADGYDAFARATKCIFDRTVIENVPPEGNYGSDLQRSLALQHAGEVVTDHRLVITGEGQRDTLADPQEGILMPVNITGPAHATDDAEADGSLIISNPGGKLPDGIVDVLRVAWNLATLRPENHRVLRGYDPNYETTQGDPQFWTWRKDGLLAIRLVPVPTSDAVYDTVNGGPFGAISQSSDTALDVSGSRGILRAVAGGFPSGGPWGSPTRIHPATANTIVEIVRLGRDLTSHENELPRIFQKYVTFFAMAQALRRDGPGQDLKLAQHYQDRFDMGVSRMQARMKTVQPARTIVMGRRQSAPGQSMGFTLPARWGEVR